MNTLGQACATYNLKIVSLSANTQRHSGKMSFHTHTQSSCNDAQNNLVLRFTNCSSQGSDGLWSGCISTLLLAARSISNRNTVQTLTNSYGGGGGKINSTFCYFGLLPQCE